MLVKSITEKEIYDIGHAFGYYDYGQETGMSAAFSGKDATANYICAYVRGVLRSGFLHTTIGENGCALSGGERQRISIARAFLKDAPIILLDEATASRLDVENETAIQEALSRLIKDKTVLIIAHRMRTVSSADKIVVLKDGTVAEQGSPAQLLHDGGIFDHMVQLQTKSQGWSLTKV